MGKNILLVTGSPRKNGNSDLMADAFTAGAQAAGHSVNRFDAARQTVGGCRACDTCWSKGVPCSFSDDFNNVFAPLLEKADALVLCMPLYFYGFPAQIKAPLDKIYSFAVPQSQKKLSIRESALLICGGDKGEESYGGATETFRQVSSFCGWANRGIVIAGGVMAKGDIAGTDFLRQAEKLGESF